MKCSILSMVLGQCLRASPQVIWDIIIFPLTCIQLDSLTAQMSED